MKKYKVMLNGQNFVLDLEQGLARHGFYTTRYVYANSKAEAELVAVESVRKRADIMRILKNDRNDPPILYAEEIDEIEYIDENAPEAGLTWFKEE
jgi:hypothetical protein